MATMSDNLETFSLIWLDASVNTSKENIEAQADLRTIINYLKTFDNVSKCEKYIRKCDESDRIVLIVSGGLGREIVPRIYKLRQVSVIYVYCMDKKKNKEWAKQYSKIKLISTDLEQLIHRIRTDHEKTKKIEEQFSITFLQDNSVTDRTSFGLNGQYVQFELLLDSLVRIEGTEKDKEELISICEKKYKDNKEEMKNVREFKHNYRSDQALWWYTKESFLYRMLNKAFRRQDTSLLYLMRFFIADIWKAIEKHRCKKAIRTYRCQSISQEEFNGLVNATGKLISMTSFVSTSLDATEARNFLESSDDFRQVFFEIDADPQLQGVKPFAELSQLSAHPKEKEVLMTVGSIYRILDVKHHDDQFWIIRMQLCSENENSLRFTIEHMKLENLVVGHEQKRLAFVTQLMKMNKLDEAEKHLRHLQDTMLDNHKDITSLYSKLGDLAFEKEDLPKSLYWYQLALDRKQKTLKENDPNLADSYNSIGNVYAKQKDNEEALKYYNKAMEIWKRNFGEQHLAIVTCLTKIDMCKNVKISKLN
ncbi:unnamed protein product [Rotaria sp. Silwood1]|nr:unnamed protein product [Rotaria sp. Silwood1]CAF4725941.1 unnamed protein product [Rotaria sp. Silwood1]